MTEADICREFVTPKLVEAGWGAVESVIGEQHSFTNSRIMVAGGKVRRGKQRRADYLLYFRRDLLLAVVEAKEVGLSAETGVQQARECPSGMLSQPDDAWQVLNDFMTYCAVVERPNIVRGLFS